MNYKSLTTKSLAVVLSIILMMTMILPTMADTVKLTDIAGNTYESIIQGFVDKGYVKGNPDGTFKPHNPISRAEFMAIVNRAFAMTETTEISFTDVKMTDWYYSEIGKAVKSGYMQGFAGKMNPKGNISRQELAVVAARLGQLDTKIDAAVLNKLTDAAAIPEWSKGAISASLSKNLFEGFVTTEFNPTRNVSRLEAVVVLDRLMKSLLVELETEQVAGGAAVVTPAAASSGGSGGGSGGSSGNDRPTLSNNKAITAFSFAAPASAGVINEALHTIAITVPYGTNVTALTPTIVHTGASISPTAAQNFTSPVNYTVTAANGTTQVYTVTVTIAANTAKSITSFSFPGLEITGTINETARTIEATVPYGTNVTALTPAVVHTGASISPTAAQNFTSPVNYTVTAANGTTQVYTVTVAIAKNPAKEITSFEFDRMLSSTIDAESSTISIIVPYGTDVTKLVPTIVHTGASVSPDTGIMQDFTSAVNYTVTAANSDTKTYSVVVTVAGKGAITGFVTENKYNKLPLPINGATVTLKQGNTEVTKVTDKFGFYVFNNISAAPGTLKFVKEGYTSGEKNVTVVANKLINVNQTLTRLDAVNTGSLVGYVTKGIQPLKDVTVSVIQGELTVAQTTTNVLGGYGFEKLSAGTYSVAFVKDDLNAKYENIVIENEKVQVLNHKFEGEILKDILSGLVSFDFEGFNCPLKDVKITIIDSEGNEVATASSETNGLYAFENLDLPDGKYTIRFEKSGFELAEQEITIITGKLQQVNQKLNALSKAVVGLVINDKHLPLAGVTVSLGERIEYTNEYGLFLMTNVPEGNGTLSFEKNGYLTGTKAVEVETAKPVVLVYQMVNDESTEINLSGKAAAKFDSVIILQSVLRLYPNALEDILGVIIPQDMVGRDSIIALISKLDIEKAINTLNTLNLMDPILADFNPQALINLIPNMPAELKDALLKIVPSSLINEIPLPGTMVTVKDQDGRLAAFTIATLDGSYDLSVADGSYTVEFKNYGYETKVLPINEVAGVTLLVPAPGKVKGTVTAQDGTPLAGVAVTVTTADGKPSAVTAADGTYTVEGIKPLLSGILGGMGVHKVEFTKTTKPRYLTAESTVFLFAGVGKVNKQLELAPAMGNLTGKVKYTGLPVIGTKVSIIGTDKNAEVELNGSYTITDIPVGTYQVKADGLKIDLGLFKVILADQVVNNVVITDGNTTTQDITMRIASNNSKLANLRVSSGTLSPAFSASNKTYTVELPYDETVNPTVSADAADPNAKVQITQINSVEGTATILVTAEDETTTTYTVAFNKGPAPVLAAIEGVSAINGTVTITLADKPTTPPIAADFTAEVSVDGADASALELTDFNYNNNETVTYKFAKIEETDALQEVIVTVKLGSSEISAPKFTVNPKQEVVIAHIESVEATNGNITITFDNVPTVEPVASDFAALIKINDGTANALNLDNFHYADGTTTFTFNAIEKATERQEVIVTITFNGVSADAKAFTVDAEALIGSIGGAVSPIDAAVHIVGTDFTTTAVLGIYAFLNVPAGTYDVEFTRDGYEDLMVRDVEVKGGSLTTVPVQTLERLMINGSINGYVSTMVLGAPLPLSGVTVNVKNGTDIIYSDTTSALGIYSIENIAEGTYTVEFVKNGYVSASTRNVEVKAGSTVTEDKSLQALTGSLSGYVSKTSFGIPVPVKNVVVNVKDGDVIIAKATTTGLGTYTINDLTVGTYTIEFINGATTKTEEKEINTGVNILNISF